MFISPKIELPPLRPMWVWSIPPSTPDESTDSGIDTETGDSEENSVYSPSHGS